ncbi:MAG: alpha/beta hydrolase [Nitrospinae bacterium RIFCSPLOWO2_12_FULL_47_7]|nr:MAG: alpha/beta hydrolase [Nitrospinae bacterium RIFCSPLOWO2_12_FULL_47_7]
MVIDVSEFKGLYPFASKAIRLGAYRYHYLDEGSGETLLMLHGNPTWSFYYRNLILGLKSRFRCIVPDHIGCGLSDKPQEYNYTLSQHIENLETLCEQLSLKDITLVLHDWGGAIGMGYAVRHPKKIKRLVLFNTAAFLSNRIPFSINICRIPVLGSIAIRCLNAFAGLAVIRACKHPMAAKVRAGFLAPYDSYSNRIANLRFVQDIPMNPKAPSYPVLQTIQSQLRQFRDRPVLIVWGKQDFCFDDHFLSRWREYFPDAEVHEIPDAGHYVVEDAYERIIPWMEKFLAVDQNT